MKHFIGIDIGTSGTKAVLFDEKGTQVSDYRVRYPLSRPQVKWAEQNPNDYFNATITCLKNLVVNKRVLSENIIALGLTGQMHGLILLDENDQLLRPAIIWCDNRTSAEVKELEKRFGKKISQVTGTVSTPAFTLAKLLWVKNNEPTIFSKINKILLPKDYVRYRLTGQFISDYSDMSGTQLINIKTYEYDKEILDYVGIDESKLPKIIASIENGGKINPKIADQIGLSRDLVVVGGAGDQAASAFGTMTFEEGQFSISLGSSGVVFAPSPLVIDETGAIQTFAYYSHGKYHIMGVTQGCALSIQWLKSNIYSRSTTFEKIEKDVSGVQIKERTPLFLPYLQGERTPILNPNAEGVVFGITADTKRNELAYSVFEGVAFSIRHSLKAIVKLGVVPKKIKVGGGMSKNLVLIQILANVLQMPLAVPCVEETGCFGAALMAGIGAGHYASVEDAIARVNHPKAKVYYPDKGLKEIYDVRFNRYVELYRVLKPLF
ncbi:MAG: Xylulose kinase [Tenericutes bacterium ADurb.Bin087]|nr:MAG: Xylulose kinase [Tenericutes bacterium ADurb.Bin087]TAH59348.1 MAG: xylulokinase [Bacillota bacterium]